MARTLAKVIANVPAERRVKIAATRRAKIAAAHGHKLIAEEQKRIAVETVAAISASQARHGDRDRYGDYCTFDYRRLGLDADRPRCGRPITPQAAAQLR